MVSNDDVGFDVQQETLIPPKELLHTSVTSTQVHNFIVPSNKQWILKGVNLYRTDSYIGELFIKNSVSGTPFLLYDDTFIYHRYEPIQELILDEGWYLTAQYFYNTTTYTCLSTILVEERNKY